MDGFVDGGTGLTTVPTNLALSTKTLDVSFRYYAIGDLRVPETPFGFYFLAGALYAFLSEHQEFDANRYRPAIDSPDAETGGFGAQIGLGAQFNMNPVLLNASLIVGYPVNRVNDAEVDIVFPAFAILQAGGEFRL
jgi:hypothetical protein